MIEIPCPFCRYPKMPNPPRAARPYGRCQNCGKKSRAAFYEDSNGKRYVKYVSTARRKLPEEYRKKVYSVRLSRTDMDAVRNGKKHLTIVNNRITLVV